MRSDKALNERFWRLPSEPMPRGKSANLDALARLPFPRRGESGGARLDFVGGARARKPRGWAARRGIRVFVCVLDAGRRVACAGKCAQYPPTPPATPKRPPKREGPQILHGCGHQSCTFAQPKMDIESNSSRAGCVKPTRFGLLSCMTEPFERSIVSLPEFLDFKLQSSGKPISVLNAKFGLFGQSTQEVNSC